MKSICVFCGSNVGSDAAFTDSAVQLGKLLAEQDISLVYGAGNVGLMGVIADACMEANGKVIGVIPNFLMAKEVGHTGIDELILTETMHERKKIMADRSEGFIAMPGGMGTMDEVCEILTWAQLGLHSHPVGVLNVNGYYDSLLSFFDEMVEKKFLHQKNRDMVISHHDPAELLKLMEAYQPPNVEKWIDRSKV
ncbi:MAG: TIGR00730 family Rossman fold protein [Bacteroidota bacterium]